MTPIRVLIVEDSAVAREFLRRIISADPRLEVAGMASNAEDALAMIHRVAPDVISLDIRLPGMNGFEATRRIMSERPTPIVVVSAAGAESEEMNLTMEALKAGAVAVVEKPLAPTHEDYAAIAGRLCTQLAIMSQVRLVRQRAIPEPSPRPARACHAGGYRVLGVAASTGGPNAILQLLNGLGRDFPLPVVAVQHMTPNFVEGFGAWLASASPFAVEIVTGRTALLPGRLYLAPPERHIAADAYWTWIEDSPPVCNHRPSAHVLFSSMARNLRDSGLGVLLSGMGEDGAEGLLEMKRAGAYTIAEHESTAVVYGMPAAAVRRGAVCEALPLQSIAPRILELTRPQPEDV
jgi:two-component system chemotaxis response regulator CheB